MIEYVVDVKYHFNSSNQHLRIFSAALIYWVPLWITFLRTNPALQNTDLVYHTCKYSMWSRIYFPPTWVQNMIEYIVDIWYHFNSGNQTWIRTHGYFRFKMLYLDPCGFQPPGDSEPWVKNWWVLEYLWVHRYLEVLTSTYKYSGY